MELARPTRHRNSSDELLAERRRFSDAEPLLLAAQAAFLATDGPDSPRTIDAAARLAAFYKAWGRPDQATRYEAKNDNGS
jgi:hypothetical protein